MAVSVCGVTLLWECGRHFGYDYDTGCSHHTMGVEVGEALMSVAEAVKV